MQKRIQPVHGMSRHLRTVNLNSADKIPYKMKNEPSTEKKNFWRGVVMSFQK